MTANDAATRAMTRNGTNLQRGRASLIALWLTQVALALLFLMAGGSKLAGVPSPSLNTAACRGSAGFGSQAFSSDSAGHLRSRESDDGRLDGFRVDHARPPSRSGRTRDNCEGQHDRWLRTVARGERRYDPRGLNP